MRISSAMTAVSKENFLSASSRMTDADIAQESASLVKNTILRDATSAVIAQANQQPSIVLSLL